MTTLLPTDAPNARNVVERTALVEYHGSTSRADAASQSARTTSDRPLTVPVGVNKSRRRLDSPLSSFIRSSPPGDCMSRFHAFDVRLPIIEGLCQRII